MGGSRRSWGESWDIIWDKFAIVVVNQYMDVYGGLGYLEDKPFIMVNHG